MVFKDDLKTYIFIYSDKKIANLLIDVVNMEWKNPVIYKDILDFDDERTWKYLVLVYLPFNIKWSTLTSKLGWKIFNEAVYIQLLDLKCNVKNEEKMLANAKSNLRVCIESERASMDIPKLCDIENYHQKRKNDDDDEPKAKISKFDD